MVAVAVGRGRPGRGVELDHPEKVLDAAKLIRDGRIYRLGRVYEAGMPLFGTRSFSLTIPGGPTGGPFGANKLVYHDEFVTGQIGQVGTQFDGFGHIGIQRGKDGDRTEMRYYNGFSEQEIAIVGRAAEVRYRAHQAAGHAWPLGGRSRVEGAHVERGGGDHARRPPRGAVAAGHARGQHPPGRRDPVYTGWGRLWMKDNAKFSASMPGIGLEVARWVAQRGLCLTGGDTSSVEVVPNPDPSLANPVHAELLTKNGIFNHENLVFDELLADRKYQFMYVFVPVPIKGATGSPGCPIAIT